LLSRGGLAPLQALQAELVLHMARLWSTLRRPTPMDFPSVLERAAADLHAVLDAPSASSHASSASGAAAGCDSRVDSFVRPPLAPRVREGLAALHGTRPEAAGDSDDEMPDLSMLCLPADSRGSQEGPTPHVGVRTTRRHPRA